MTLPKSAVVFAGPSLPADVRARCRTDTVSWHPPARRGDLARLDLEPESQVVLIDGYLIRQHPPSPTEVFDLLCQGHTVWGCSSLGALRAAELRHHGMRGYGWVYERVLDRTITFDDELVATRDPRTDEPVSLFLANIRHGLGELLDDGHISLGQAHRLIDDLRTLHYEQRTARRCGELATAAGFSTNEVSALLGADIKQRDAEGLLTRLFAAEPTR